MATYYVSSVDGDNADDGSTWALAKATVAGALAVATADGDIIYVDSAHAFTATAAITWNAATAGTSIRIISVNRNGSTTTGHSGWLAGAAESIGAASSTFTIANTGAQNLFIYGMTLTGSTNNTVSGLLSVAQIMTAVAAEITFSSCVLSCPSIHAGALITFGPVAGANARQQKVVLLNTDLKVRNSATGNAVALGTVKVDATNITVSYSGANKPLSLFSFITTQNSHLRVRDSDISGYNTTSGFLFDVANWFAGDAIITNCKYSATPGVQTGTWASNDPAITLINSDSGDTHNVFEYRNRLGTITENSSQFANSGAQFDASGISWEIVTTAACSEQVPFVTPWLHRWLDTTGSQDLHLQLIRDNATDYTNREVWGEFECSESSTFPNGTLTSTRNSQPFDGTPADLTNSAKTWTETLTNDNEMECRVTRTVAEKGLARARLFVGVASTTLYLDPSLWTGS